MKYVYIAIAALILLAAVPQKATAAPPGPGRQQTMGESHRRQGNPGNNWRGANRGDRNRRNDNRSGWQNHRRHQRQAQNRHYCIPPAFRWLVRWCGHHHRQDCCWR